MNKHFIPEVILERFSLGELNPIDTARVAAILEREKDLPPNARGCTHLLASIEQSSSASLCEYPPDLIASTIQKRLPSPKARTGLGEFFRMAIQRSPALSFGVPALGLALILSAVILMPNTLELTRPKGAGPFLSIYRRAGKSYEKLSASAVVQKHDLLQLSYHAGGDTYGAILSMDARGEVTLHYPNSYGMAPKLMPAGEAILASAFEIDDSPGFEKFFFFTSSHPFDIGGLAGAMHAAGGSFKLPKGVRLSSVMLKKANQ